MLVPTPNVILQANVASRGIRKRPVLRKSSRCSGLPIFTNEKMTIEGWGVYGCLGRIVLK
jgi:hypothetical protein